MNNVISTCVVNRQLLKDVVAKLTDLAELTKAQQAAALNEEAELIEELHVKIRAAYKAKERAVESWVKHHREHGC